MCLTKKRENPVWALTCLPLSMNKSIACITGYILSSIAILTFKPHVKRSWSAGLNRTVRYLYSAKN